jgi:hypothetical protein
MGMASKLFRAVVGFGIALGAASGACFGASSDTPETVTEGADASTSTPTTNTPSSSGSSNGDPSSTQDGSSVADAGVDAPKDVGVDAFCDAAWPTTKGNPQPPSCVDPNGECVDAGTPEHCYAVADGGCDVAKMTFPYCVNKDWQCQPGTTNAAGCN